MFSFFRFPKVIHLDLFSFITYASDAVNFPLNTAFAASHTF